MKLGFCHAKLFGHKLEWRSPSHSVEGIAGLLVDAQVDLNPRQVEAALFVFHSPLSVERLELPALDTPSPEIATD